MNENCSFEITISHSYFIVLGSFEDPEIKKINLEKFINELISNEEIMNAYQLDELDFSNKIDEFTKDEIKAALDEALNSDKMSELIKYADEFE